jgi:hypothetical protein
MRATSIVSGSVLVGVVACLGARAPLGAEPAPAPRLELATAVALHGHGGLKLTAVLKNAGGGSLTFFVPERFTDNDFPGWRIVGADGAAYAPYQPPYQSMWTEGDQGSLVTLPAGQRWRVEHEVPLFVATGGAGGAAVGEVAGLTPLPLPPGRYTVHAWHEHARAEVPVGLPMFKTTTRPVQGLWTGKVEAAPVTIEVPRPPIVSLALDAPRDVVPGEPYVVCARLRNDTTGEVRLPGRFVLEAASKMHGVFRVELPWPEQGEAPAPAGATSSTLTLAPGGERLLRVDLAPLKLRGGRGAPVERSLADALGQGLFHLQARLGPADPAEEASLLTSNGLWG